MTTETQSAQRASVAAGVPPRAAASPRWSAEGVQATVAAHADLLAFGILLVALAGYLFNLGGWLITDDEGSYFYQSWRVSLGELPYRDFLTPQLPLFLGAGGLVQRVVGVGPVPLRVVSVLLVMGAAWAFYRVLRRYTAPALALAGMVGFLAFPDVYAVGRVYRPEPYMLFFIALGTWAFVVGEERGQRRWLVLSGALFGLGILTKLFAVLALAGVGLYLLSDLRLKGTIVNRQSSIASLLALGVPAVLVAGGVMSAFLLLVPNTYTAVFGHQLMQGSQLSRWDVFWKGLEFYRVYFARYAPLLVFSLPMAVVVWRRGSRATLLAWQLPTLILFILLSRELWPRHLVYLAPAFVGLWAMSLEPMLTWARRGFLLAAIVGAILLPWVFENNIAAHYSEQGTWRIADFMGAEVGADGSFLADYPELNYYARRPTGYTAASLSQGAASSGQITGAVLARELDAMGGTAVVVELSEFGQMRFLRDRKEFQAYLDQNFRPLGIFHRNQQLLQIYRRQGAPAPGPELNFGNQLTLFTGNAATDQVASGGTTEVGLRFGVRAPAPPDRDVTPLDKDYVAFIHVQDADGNVWGQGDGALTNSLKKLTSGWEAGELNADRIAIAIRPGTPPGVYDVVVGVYDRLDQNRLSIVNAQGNPTGTEYRLGQLTVTPAAKSPAPGDLKLTTSLDADLGAARLVGVSQDRATVDAGDSVRFELGWQGRQTGDVTLALTLLGAGGEVDRQSFSLNMKGGEVRLGQYNVPVDADVPGGDYQVRAQLLDANRAPLGEAVSIGQLTVRPVAASFEKPTIRRPLRVDLGGRVDLAGYDLAADTVTPGGVVDLTLYWHPQGRIGQNLKVFTHLVAPDGRIVGQRDSVPVEGARPTTGWRPGEYIADRYRIPVPRDAPPGRYELRTGLYNEASGERLPVQVDGKPAPDGQAVLGSVEVKP